MFAKTNGLLSVGQSVPNTVVGDVLLVERGDRIPFSHTLHHEPGCDPDLNDPAFIRRFVGDAVMAWVELTSPNSMRTTASSMAP